MIVRIRISTGAISAGFKSACSGLLGLAGVVCFIVGAWILSSDLGWTAGFIVREGWFSHWQVWAAFGVVAQLCSFRLSRERPAVRSNT